MHIDWWTLGLQTVNFLIVIWLLSRFLYRPIRRIIEQRETADRQGAEDARKKTEAAEAARQAYERERADLAEAHRKREAELHASTEQERATILEQARREAAELLANARAKTERESVQALENLKGRVTDLARDLARTALAGPGAEDAIARVTAYLADLPGSDLEDLRQDLNGTGATVTVVTPAALSDQAACDWRETLAERFGASAHVAFEARPDILGGAEIHFPHAVLRFSAADRLERAAAALRDQP